MQNGYRIGSERVQNGVLKEIRRVQKTSIYDPGAALTTPEARAVFITDAFESGDAVHIAAAIGVAVRGFGLNDAASLTGITVTDLEQLFSAHGDPDLDRLMKVLRVLGLSLSVAPTRFSRPGC